MPRLRPQEGEEAYRNGRLSSYVVCYDHEQHGEEMMDLATGLIGALLRLKLPSISGPEIGSPIPMVVTYVDGDLLRIFIDPHVEPFGEEIATGIKGMKKARQHVELTALSYQGEPMYLNTADLDYANHIGLAIQLQYQANKIGKIRREV